jgi:geranylgeranyl pyrophosphate synthase
MFQSKYLLKSFTSKMNTPGRIQVINKYKHLFEKASYITDELFPKKMNSSDELRNYLKVSEITKNATIEGKEQLNSINDGLFTPGWDMLKRGGKQWRPMLGLIIGNYFKIPIEDVSKSHLLYKLLAITELIHNASLIVDDVEDKSILRRNEPCVHLKFGESIAINAGITMFYLPVYRLIKEIKDMNLKAKIAEFYFEEMSAIHVGQGWDIEMKVEKRLPSIDNYKDTVLFKTGVCPRLIVKSIKVLLEDNYDNTAAFKDFMDIVDHISIGFQIKDDLLNITKSNLAKGKGYAGEDIYEGKLTLMVLHTLNSQDPNSRKERLKEILELKTKDESLINEAIEILNKNKSIEFAINIMESHVNKAEEKCKILAMNKNFNTEAVQDLLELVNFLIDRK